MDAIKQYLSEIGRKGGQKSRRAITPEQQKSMQKARIKARRLRLLESKKVKDLT